MRINKYIAQSGAASRRLADELIEAGKVKVNGKVLRQLGYDVQPGDVVEVSGRIVEPEDKNVYLLLNKPTGYVTTTLDKEGRPTVFDLVTDVDVRLFPVGRLDYNTSGLLILTNDGDLANKLMHPRHEFVKRYRVRVSGMVSRAKAEVLARGVDIGGYVTAPAEVEVIRHDKNSTILEIAIHEGKNRQVRRMCRAIGHPVQELTRIGLGKLVIGRLAVGGYRKLSKEEVKYLKELV
ncbi:MAG: rRNA pseudouridine synthase [Mogibacterium sp.]|nr:rRNA pseudouridine synthase [Mogibacterium sp.]